MAAQSAATKLVTQAAREHLQPLGLQQRGGSRLWLDDHGWWVVVVAFESPAHEQGAGLSVFADFLWHGSDYVAFAVGGRVGEQGSPFDQDDRRELVCRLDADEAGFERCMATLAGRAAEEVAAWRERFPSLERWAEYLDQTAGRDEWRRYDAAVAAALTGDAKNARKWFRRAARTLPEARQMRDLLGDPTAFEAEAAQRARAMREHLGLRPEIVP